MSFKGTFGGKVVARPTNPFGMYCLLLNMSRNYPLKTNMTMKNLPFEDMCLLIMEIFRFKVVYLFRGSQSLKLIQELESFILLWNINWFANRTEIVKESITANCMVVFSAIFPLNEWVSCVWVGTISWPLYFSTTTCWYNSPDSPGRLERRVFCATEVVSQCGLLFRHHATCHWHPNVDVYSCLVGEVHPGKVLVVWVWRCYRNMNQPVGFFCVASVLKCVKKNRAFLCFTQVWAICVLSFVCFLFFWAVWNLWLAKRVLQQKWVYEEIWLNSGHGACTILL